MNGLLIKSSTLTPYRRSFLSQKLRDSLIVVCFSAFLLFALGYLDKTSERISNLERDVAVIKTDVSAMRELMKHRSESAWFNR